MKYLLFFLFNVNYCIAQTYDIDTVVIERTLITITDKHDLKTKHPIDIIRGFYFIEQTESEKHKKIETLKLETLKRSQNSIYFLANSTDFYEINYLFFKKNLKCKDITNIIYPTLNNWTYRDKQWLYYSKTVRIKCLKIYMEKTELKYFISLDQYKFNTEKTPVYIVEEITYLN